MQRSSAFHGWFGQVRLSSFFLGAVAILAGCNGAAHNNHTAVTSPTPRIPAYFADVSQARPFAAVLDPKRYSDPNIVKAYSYAQQLPEVFAQQPCYCYCDDGEKHTSLYNCFTTEHGAG